jgi:hypothetical protein
MKKTNLKIIQTRISPHVSFDEIREFEEAFLKNKRFSSVSGPRPVPFLKCNAFATYIISTAAQKLFSAIPRKASPTFFNIGYVSPHHAVYKAFPYFTLPLGARCIWIYDAWPHCWQAIERFAITYKIKLLLFSSLQAARHFKSRNIRGCRVEWLPEAVTVDDYQSKPYRQRQTDILQIGRRWNEYHEKIRRFVEGQGYTYKYEKRPGELIFEGRQAFINGLADSKISVCVPASVTHPERSGGIETMTWRYLQSMASRCLILGRMPQEMRQLFDYAPVIEIDIENSTGQLGQILRNFEDYIPLIEKNYEYVCQHHQWKHRVAALIAFVDGH